MITLANITKRFGNFTAVNSISLQVKPGEFYGFLGPNGAGKTTTIKMMTGLYAPSAGQITINGFDITVRPKEAKLAIGYIPDQPYLYDKLTGREYLYFSGGLYRIQKAHLRIVIDQLVERLELGEWIDRRCEEYSQGMRQRVVIAAALLHDPPVIIIDEPMVGLDPRSARIVKQTLLEKARAGSAVFMSTHSLPVIEELCDRVGIINDGKLIYENTMSGLQQTNHSNDGTLETLFLELTR